MYFENKIMVGIDISSISSAIKELEWSKDEWNDGLKGYSLNYHVVKTGYCSISRLMFGKVIAEDVDFTSEEGDTILVFDAFTAVSKYEAEIVERFKEFLADYPTLDFKGELKIQFASVVGRA